MAQYKTGTISVTNGSATVTGSGTAWSTNAQAGNTFKIKGESVIYTVASVNSDTSITLSANYAGSTGSGKEYIIGRDFTTNHGLTEINPGDVDWPTHLTEGVIRKLDTLLAGLKDETVTTTDATSTALATRTLTEGKTYLVVANVVAKQGDTNRATYVRRACVYRPAAGAATLQGTVQDGLTVESAAGWDCAIDVSGNNVRVTVTGAAASTVNWKGHIELIEV